MAENSGIEWTHHTFNPWRGCTKISAGCTNCYAETLSGRNPKTLGVWGPKGTRVVASESQWRLPLKWDRAAKAAGQRHRVFCASLADVFEDWNGEMTGADGRRLWVSRSIPAGCAPEFISETHQGDFSGCVPMTMDHARLRLERLIVETPNLDWLLLTKRPENVAKYLAKTAGSTLPSNIWLGVSVENQAAADERIPLLLQTPAAVRFLSCEPLLGPLKLTSDFGPSWLGQSNPIHDCINWVIVGGESGPGARPCDVAWIRSIVEQCKAAGVACFVKQLGASPIESAQPTFNVERRIPLEDRKGGDPEEWPLDLRVREFPEVPHA